MERDEEQSLSQFRERRWYAGTGLHRVFLNKNRKAEFYSHGEGKKVQQCEVLQKGRWSDLQRSKMLLQ